MNVNIEIRTGPHGEERVKKRDIQKNIDAIDRAISGNLEAADFISLADTNSILRGIQVKLRE